MESLAGYKMISIVLLTVLVALAGVSPVFAPPFMTLTPVAACPGAELSLVAVFPGVTPAGLGVAITSDPTGLVQNIPRQPLCDHTWGDPDGLTLDCAFLVSESASCGHYVITLTITLSDGGTKVASLPADFDVAGSCCPAVGGCVEPVNTFALLSPWLAVIGVVGCIGTVAVITRKRRQ